MRGTAGFRRPCFRVSWCQTGVPAGPHYGTDYRTCDPALSFPSSIPIPEQALTPRQSYLEPKIQASNGNKAHAPPVIMTTSGMEKDRVERSRFKERSLSVILVTDIW